jgi:hypothetical protein
MTVSDKLLGRWCIVAVVLLLVGILLANFGLKLESPLGLGLRALYGLIAASVVIGFYLYMLATCLRRERGWRKVVLVSLFLLFPILFAFLYYWWAPAQGQVRSA